MRATDTEDDLRKLERALRRHSRYVDTDTFRGVSFAEGHDPDGIRVVIAHPSPACLPRRSLNAPLRLVDARPEAGLVPSADSAR